MRKVGLALAPLAGLGIVITATGWLYLLRPRVSLPGPVVGDALPLDELSRHSGVPLLLFVAVWRGSPPRCSASSRAPAGSRARRARSSSPAESGSGATSRLAPRS